MAAASSEASAWASSSGAQASNRSRADALNRSPPSCNSSSSPWLMPASLCWLRSVSRQGSVTPVAPLSPNTAPTSGANASTWGVITRMSRGSSSGSAASSCNSRSRTTCSWRSRPGQAWNSREVSPAGAFSGSPPSPSAAPLASRSCSCSSSEAGRPCSAATRAGAKNRSPSRQSPSWFSPLPSSNCWNSAPSRPKRASSPGTSSNQSLLRGSRLPAASRRCQRSRQGVSR